MKLFITNDDGYDAAGIVALREALRGAGHDVFELAPWENQSAKSHSLRVSGDMTLRKHSEGVHSIDGTPADTVIFFDRRFSDFKPDVVVSGINSGLNVSSDIIYSGTCAAAREASLRGYRSIAISCQAQKDGLPPNYALATDFLLANLELFCRALDRKGVSKCYLNVNVPLRGCVDDFEYASLTPLNYDDVISEEPNATGDSFSIHYSHCGIKVNEASRDKRAREETDLEVIGKGFISLTFVSSFLSWDNSGA